MVYKRCNSCGVTPRITWTHIYIYIYIGWIQILLGVTLSNIIPPNNLLLISFFENLTIELHILYVLNMHVIFHVNQILFLIWSIKSSFMRSFKLQKLEFKQGQNLATKLVVALSYNLIQYLFIGDKFWQIHNWITSSSYILYACKISRKLKMNNVRT